MFIALLLAVVRTKSSLPSTVNGARPAVFESALRTLSLSYYAYLHVPLV